MADREALQLVPPDTYGLHDHDVAKEMSATAEESERRFLNLHHAAACGSIPGCTYALDVEGVDVNEINDFDESALYCASLCGHLHVVKYLLSKGARAEPYTFDGERVVYAALTDEIRRVLLQSRTAEARIVSPLHTQLNKMLNQASEGATTADFKFLVLPTGMSAPSQGCVFELPCLPHKRPASSSTAPTTAAAEDASTPVAVHKAVLAARSDFFATSFADGWGGLQCVFVPGGAPAAVLLRSIVRWAYTDTVAVPQGALQQLRALVSHLHLARMEAALALRATSEEADTPPDTDSTDAALASAGAVLHVDCAKVLQVGTIERPPVRAMLLDTRQRQRLPSQLPFGSAGSSFKGTAAGLVRAPTVATTPRLFYPSSADGRSAAAPPGVPHPPPSPWGAAAMAQALPPAAFYFAAINGRELHTGHIASGAELQTDEVAAPAPPTPPAGRAPVGGAAAGDVFQLQAEPLTSMPSWQTAKGLHGRPGVHVAGTGGVDILQLRTAASQSRGGKGKGAAAAPARAVDNSPEGVLQRARLRTLEHDMQRLLASVDVGERTCIVPDDAALRALACLAATPLAADAPDAPRAVHKSMFLARSPYWRAQFAPQFATGEERVDLAACPPPVARCVLRFVYCCAGVQAVDERGTPLHEFTAGHLAADVPPSQLSTAQLVQCAHLADLLLLPDLRALCAAAAVKCTTLATAVPFYAMADAFTMKRLASQSARVMAVHLDCCVLRAEWLQLALDSAASIKGRQETDSVPLIDDIMGELQFVEGSVTRELEANCRRACAGAEGVEGGHDLQDVIAAVRGLPEHIMNSSASPQSWSPRAAATRRRRLAIAVLELMGIAIVTHQP